MGQKLDTTAEIVKSYCTLKAGYTSEFVGCAVSLWDYTLLFQQKEMLPL